VSIAEKIRGRVLEQLHCFDSTSVWNVWTSAKVDQRTTSIDGSRSAVRDLVSNDVLLVFVIREHFQQVLLGQGQSFKLLFFLDCLLCNSLQLREIARGNGSLTVINAHFVVKT